MVNVGLVTSFTELLEKQMEIVLLYTTLPLPLSWLPSLFRLNFLTFTLTLSSPSFSLL